MGNAGHHYLLWRYHDAPVRPPAPGISNLQPHYSPGTTLYRYDRTHGPSTTLLTLPSGAATLSPSACGMPP